jgi:hypothetical protein
MRTVYLVSRWIQPDGFKRWSIIGIHRVPPSVASEHVAWLFSTCRRVSDRHDYHLDEIAFGGELLL